MLTPEAIRNVIADMDCYEATAAQFMKEAEGDKLWWALQSRSDAVLLAVELTRLARPLLKELDETPSEEWNKVIVEYREEKIRELIGGRLWKGSEGEPKAEAYARFIDRLRYL